MNVQQYQEQEEITMLQQKRMEAIEQVASLLKSSKKIVVLMGAGISVGAGIPDFRSPKSGMYATLRPERLTASDQQKAMMQSNPVAVVDYELFRYNAFPYLEVRKPFILGINEGRWKPTVSHHFFEYLASKDKITRVFSQNIDGLEYVTGINPEKVVSCHGTLAEVACEACGSQLEMPWFLSELKSKIKDIYGDDETAPKTSSPINCPKCNKAQVKPTTVLYGRSLPRRFFDLMEQDLPGNVDLLCVIGTSLTVGPANLIPECVGATTPRVIVNMEPCGEGIIQYSSDSFVNGRDFFLQGQCDEIIQQLIDKAGMRQDFEKHMNEKANAETTNVTKT